MRKSKGKWVFNYKETYNLNSALSPVIGAGLQKFYDTLKTREASGKCFGVPDEFYDAEADGAERWYTALEAMIYSFTAEEPDMESFGVSLDMKFVELPEGHPAKGTCKTAEFTYTPNKEAYDVYKDACHAHHERVQYGLELFGKHYRNLWW